jgi:hypothetical protein
MNRLLLAFILCSSLCNAKDLSNDYKSRFLVVMKDGLSLGVCANSSLRDSFLRVRITEDGVDTKPHGLLENLPDDKCNASTEPVHKGEVLRSKHAAVRGKWLLIWVESVSPHAIDRGIGAFEHQSYESPSAILMFPCERGVAPLAEEWLSVFDTQAEAVKLGNTASGVFVNQIKLGMSFAEVESALGPPVTRADLGAKVIYKYKDMTVEFRDGKVADVR